MIELYKYKLQDENCYYLNNSTSNQLQIPVKLAIKLISGDDLHFMIRSPNNGLFNLKDELISPLYKGELELPNVTWGYTKDGAGLICNYDVDELEIILFQNARNIIHSIYYDYLNGRHDKTIESLQVTYSNMRTQTVSGTND